MSEDAPNNEKEELQAALRELGATVNEAWEVPALKRKLTMELAKNEDDDEPAPAKSVAKPVSKPKAGLVEMVLLKNYRPGGEFAIVGHQTEERLTKSPSGELVVSEPSRFVDGEIAPAPLPGVGYEGKIWAGTVIRLPREEAMRLYDKGIAKRGFD